MSCDTTDDRARAIEGVRDEELFERWQGHEDEHARELIVERYLPLARKLARRYNQSTVPYEDLVQVASLGLLKAIDRYDVSRGSFASYAIPTILGEIRRHFRDHGWATHVPRGAQERALAIRDAIGVLAGKTGHEPTVNELAVYMELDVEHVVDGLQALRAYEAQSLETPVGEDNLTYIDTIGREDQQLELVDDRLSVIPALRHLTPAEREILELRYAGELTQREIGERLGISQMQISRVLKRSLNKLHELTTA